MHESSLHIHYGPNPEEMDYFQNPDPTEGSEHLVRQCTEQVKELQASPDPLLGRKLGMFGQLLAPAHPDGLPLPPLVPGISAILLVQGGLRNIQHLLCYALGCGNLSTGPCGRGEGGVKGTVSPDFYVFFIIYDIKSVLSVWTLMV